MRGRAEDPAWARPALIALLVGTAAAYLVDLAASGYGNGFYSAAAQAATKSWKAFLFGSLDSSNFITVDKPPASIWVMALAGRTFGFSSLSVLVPQALEGVASVWLLYATVKRWFGSAAGLLAGLGLAITPVAALMFRFNNPDALLVCALLAAAYCVVRALEAASTGWILGAGTLIGFAFLTKMLQAFLVVPAFAFTYLLAAPTELRRRLWQLSAGGAAVAVSGGWWVALVAVWPSSARPMIDGSTKNSILDLITGYNGLGRVFGGVGAGGAAPSGGLPPGGLAGPNFSGPPGLLRLFNDLMGGQASWLLPVALVAFCGGLWATRRRPRTDRTRAALLIWGGWLLVSGVVFSLSTGVIHTYYVVALAPAIAALMAIGAVAMWPRRERLLLRLGIAGGVLFTAVWSWILLGRTPLWQPWLRPLILAAGVLGAALVASDAGRARRLTGPGMLLAAFACLAGPFAYSLDTIAAAHTGSLPAAGPQTSASTSAGAGPVPGESPTPNAALARALKHSAGRYRWVAATAGSQPAASLELASGGAPVMAIGGFNNQGGDLSLARFEHYVSSRQIHYYVVGSGAPGAGPPGPGGLAGPPPGAPGGRPPPGALPGGPPPGTGPGRAPGSSTGAITAWVKAHFKSSTVGGQIVYDLTRSER